MSEKYDVAVIGGGVVGCSVLFRLTNQGYKCVLLEKEAHLLTGASCGNSGMLHTGFDAPKNSIELSCIQKTQQQIFELLHKFGLLYRKFGATMVAWTDDEVTRLPHILQESTGKGIPDIQTLSLSQLHQMEPHLSHEAKGAIFIPGETVTDSWLMPIVMADHAKSRGAVILTDTLAQNFEKDDYGNWNISTNKGYIKTSLVINCAGLYGDIVDKLSGHQTFNIKPRKGQYVIHGHTAKSLINSSIVPVPTNIGKGIIVFKSVYENVTVGPTSENVDDRHIPIIDPIVTNRLKCIGQHHIPGLDTHRVVSMYTGVRPATEYKDYQINSYTDRSWITVGGIRSTGLSGSLGIADMINDMVREKFYMEPSSAPNNTIDRVKYSYNGRGIVDIGNTKYTITHPLSRAGFDYGIIGRSNL